VRYAGASGGKQSYGRLACEASGVARTTRDAQPRSPWACTCPELNPCKRGSPLAGSAYAVPVTSYELEVRESDLGEVTLVELAGELDLTNAEELQQRLDALAEEGSSLVLELNKLRFLDSAALHVLFRLAVRLSDDGRRLGVVLDASAPVAKTVELVSLDQAADVRPSLSELLAEPRA